MFYATNRNFPICSQVKGMFRKRLAESLRKRMFPNTNLTAKQLAAALNVSDDTIYHWMRAENTADGDNTGALIAFFASQQDHSFIGEIFPEGVIPLVQKRREADAALALFQTMKATFQQLEAVA